MDNSFSQLEKDVMLFDMLVCFALFPEHQKSLHKNLFQ